MLRLMLENLETVDAVFHEHYTEKDGKFYLDLEGDIRQHPKGLPLQAALDRIKKEKTTLTDKLSEVETKLADLPEDFNAEEYARLKDEAEARKKKKKTGEENDEDEESKQRERRLYEQRIANLESKHAEARAKLEEEKGELTAQIERVMGDEGLTKALVAAGVKKKLLEGATSLLRKSVRVVRDPDTKEWRSFVETDIGETTIDEFVANWAQSDEGDEYITKADGGGAPGSTESRMSDNPFVTVNGSKPNLTRQQELIQRNPERARVLAQAAGVTPNW